MAEKSKVRNRKKTSKKDKEKEKPSVGDTQTQTSNTIQVDLDDGAETLSKTFYEHPLVRVAPFIVIPYIIYNAIYLLTLRHPEIVTQATFGLVPLRPSMAPTDPRQVLLLGAEVPENRFVAGGLASPLKLEIVHEAFDAHNFYCRDGTSSWFQFMRLLDPITDTTPNKEAVFGAWKQLCADRNHSMIELFHPKEYAPSNCRSFDNWSQCWARECYNLVKSQWACEHDENRDCPFSFARTLHQVRHPMHTIASLNHTICTQPKLEKAFLAVVAGFFPNRKWTDLSCANAMAWYTVDFQSAMIKAREDGYVHGIFQIERTSPCEVANLAGFSEEYSALYAPNNEKVNKACRDEDTSSDALSPETFTNVKLENNKKSAVPDLALDELQDAHLVNEIKKLVSALGYDNEEESQFL